MSDFQPAYLGLIANGELEERVQIAYAHLDLCDVCAWECRVDRANGKLGICRTGLRARVASFGAHHGEEAPLSGWRGSGTIFFGRCNLHCQYCQNFDISQNDAGEELEPEAIAHIMLALQEAGCHNVNLVSPSHVVPQILAATLVAARAGLRLPLVYNTGGYDSLQALRWLEGVVDIYMPDMKYASAQTGLHYSKIRDYPQVNQEAVREMHRQVGDLKLDADGIAQRGLLVRHLVLPNRLGGTAEVVHFLAEQISTETYLNLMDQYRPTFHASQFPKINRRIYAEEMEEAVLLAHQAGLNRLDSGR